MNNLQVVDRFWTMGEPAHSRSLFYKDGKLFSYGICILQRRGNYVIANGTNHQKIARVGEVHLTLYDVPRGTHDLLGFAILPCTRLGNLLGYN
jgi:hypothetical protein